MLTQHHVGNEVDVEWLSVGRYPISLSHIMAQNTLLRDIMYFVVLGAEVGDFWTVGERA